MPAERPPQNIIDIFYKLSDYNPQKRLTAARELLENEETINFKDYVLDRLLKGLSSGKSGARLGFSTALSVFLHENPKLMSAQQFLELVEDKLPLSVSKKERAPNAIGQHIAFVAVYSSLAFLDKLGLIINKHIVVLDEAPFLRLAFADAITSMFANLKSKNVKTDVLPSKELLKLLDLVEAIERGEAKPELYGRFSKELVSKLDDDSYLMFAKKSLDKESWAFNRLVLSFGQRNIEIKQQILQMLQDIEEKNAQTFNVSCTLVERLFRLLWRKGQLKDVVLRDEDQQLLLNLFSTSKKAKSSLNKTLEVVSAICRFMSKVAINKELIERFRGSAEEAHALAKHPDSTILINFCLTLLPLRQRLGRTLVHYITANEHQLFGKQEIQSAIAQYNEGDEEDDGEFKPITEEERRLVHAKWAAEEAENDGEEDGGGDAAMESDEDSLSDMETDEEEAVDPELKASLQAALGNMAMTEEDDTDIEVDLDDDEIEELDRSLGAALKPIIQKQALVDNRDKKSVFWLEQLIKFKEQHKE